MPTCIRCTFLNWCIASLTFMPRPSANWSIFPSIEHAANENTHKQRVRTRHDNTKACGQWKSQAASYTAQDITWNNAVKKNMNCMQQHKKMRKACGRTRTAWTGAGSLGSCWGLLFPGMEKFGGVGGAAGDLNNCTWVVSSDTCATNACTARPVFNIFSSWRSIRALLPANSSCKPRVSAESMKIGQILLSQWRR